jgi:hypothetical protein
MQIERRIHLKSFLWVQSESQKRLGITKLDLREDPRQNLAAQFQPIYRALPG